MIDAQADAAAGFLRQRFADPAQRLHGRIIGHVHVGCRQRAQTALGARDGAEAQRGAAAEKGAAGQVHAGTTRARA